MPTSMAMIAPILLLVASNIFMTFAWYGHLGDLSRPVWLPSSTRSISST